VIFGKSKEEQLIDAVKEGDINIVTRLINKGANVNYRKKEGQITPLDCAVVLGKLDIVKLLISNGADINSRTPNGYTALLIAAANWPHDPDIIDTLIRHGADVNAKSFVERWTPLLYASNKALHNEPVIKMLVEAGAQINDHNVFGETPLMYAAAFGSEGLVDYLLNNGADPKATNEDGLCAIHFAARSTGEALLHALEASIALSLKLVARKPTFYEAWQRLADDFSRQNSLVRPKVIKLLLKCGADIDATTVSGLTPLKYALFADNFEIANVIIQYGADIDAGDETALMTAVWANRIDIVKFVVEKGADVNHTKATGENALEWAIFHGNDDIAKLLLNTGAKKNFSKIFRKLTSENEAIVLTLKRLGLTL
jgi:ankyrin repeat protein